MIDSSDANQHIERMGRIAIATQGLLYGIVGLLAARVAGGDHDAEPSQRGAIHAVAVQPLGRVLLAVLAVGLASYAAWRALLAYRGELGEEDGPSIAKRVANVARCILYLSLTFAAVRVVTGSGHSGAGRGSSEAKRSTSTALGLPGGRGIVIAVGLAIVAGGLWNAKRAITRSFVESLDLSSLDEGRQRTVEILGVVGYFARGAVYVLVGWFLIAAGMQKDPGETRDLDDSLRKLASTSNGPLLLLAVALGLIAFGAYRIADANLRRPIEVTQA